MEFVPMVKGEPDWDQKYNKDMQAAADELNTHTSNTAIHVSSSVIESYDTAIAGLIAHTEDRIIHVTAEEKALWNKAAQTAAQAASIAQQALTKTAELEGRVARLEDALFSNITGNPFLVSFDTLNGVILTKGIWNAAQKRIEC